MKSDMLNRAFLVRFAYLSLGASIITMAIKFVAFVVTDSVGLLSDVLESLVNLLGALIALSMLIVAAKPADEKHAYGHSKTEYFSSGIEGLLIIIAALGIIGTALKRLIHPVELKYLERGILFSLTATLINLVVALILLRVGKQYQSITLEANGRHLLSDVWTTGGVIVGVSIVSFTGWSRIDPLIAAVLAANILLSGIKLVRRSVAGFMDEALPLDDQKRIREILDTHRHGGVDFHALRTRQAGARKFISFHVLTPGDWTVQHGHELLECIEADIRKAIPNASIFTHLESSSDPTSWDDYSTSENKKAPQD